MLIAHLIEEVYTVTTATRKMASVAELGCSPYIFPAELHETSYVFPETSEVPIINSEGAWENCPFQPSGWLRCILVLSSSLNGTRMMHAFGRMVAHH
jgi:hypothetical protein